ncbi:hypothetical protein HX017_16630 [Myroides marinus]|nr:hypothetical protein [Myroides marinus]KUF46911.1 hypothetical protein AS361_15990 [Myroides marinus]MDM1349731.1 hypothetical protein [Myroides marinus]MDM1356940.1 hypothetical protein [Myroides marinus]MDM1366558.1 hypothetical protein [Myroides marinus]
MRFNFKINKARELIKNISNNEFYYLSEEKHLMKYLNGNEIALINNFKCEIVEEWSKGFLINENAFYNFSFCELLFNDDNIYKGLIINNKELLIKKIDFENEMIQFGFYNHIHRNIEWKSTDNNIVPYFSISNNTFISFSELSFKNFDFAFNLLWQFKFVDVIQSENAFLHSKIIENDDKLFFVIDGSENRGLFCLDTKTGKILQKFSVCYYDIFQDKNYI